MSDVQQKELRELKASEKVESKEGAALQVRTYKIPARIQKRISRALKFGKKSADR
jgi:hypothetical protein